MTCPFKRVGRPVDKVSDGECFLPSTRPLGGPTVGCYLSGPVLVIPMDMHGYTVTP